MVCVCIVILTGMTPTIIGHLDADCFYVSAERVRFPHLRGQPVGVLGNQGACVIAKSYEMKASGVSTGMPIWDALKHCPDAIFVKRDFRWYEVLSRRMLSAVKEVSPTVEYYSIDECFFDAGTLPQSFGQSMDDAACALQQRMLKRTGVPVSLGISRSKILAKLASDAEKPFGCTVLLDQSEIQDYLKRQTVGEITGIGRRSLSKLASCGIFTCEDFANANRNFIRKLLTVKGERIWLELRGEPAIPIQTRRPMHKCVARGGSLGRATADRERLLAWVVRNVERLVEALDTNGYVCGRLTMDLQHKDGTCRSKRASLPEDTAEFELLAPTAKALLPCVWIPGQSVAYMHLIAERLRVRGIRQLSLFQSTPARVDRLKRIVNGKIGRFAIRSGDTLALDDVYADEANDYDICDVHGKMCF